MWAECLGIWTKENFREVTALGWNSPKKGDYRAVQNQTCKVIKVKREQAFNI